MERAGRRFLAPVAAALFVGLGGVCAGGDNPAGPVAAAAGHPVRLHLHAETVLRHDGGSMVATLDAAGTSRLARECDADLCAGTWFDGTQTFTFGLNGTPLHAGDRDDATERTVGAIVSTAFAEPAFLGAGGRVTQLAAGPAGDLRFRVAAPGGTELVAVADPATDRLVAIERSDGSRLEQLVASGVPPALIYAERSFEHVRAVAGGLSGPAGPATRVAGARALPLMPGSLPVVPCRLAGREAACLIDSGTTPSAVTLALAERLGREPRGAIEIAGLGSYLTGVIDAEPLELGGATIDGLHFAVIPHVPTAGFDVILGSDVLARLRIVLDAPARTAEISADGVDTGASIAIDFRLGLPFADVRLNDRPEAQAMLIDTGDTDTVSIGYDQFRREPELFTPAGRSRAHGMGEATMDTVDGQLERLAVGPVRLDRVGIAAVRGQHQGHLGYGFAVRCERFELELGKRRIGCSGGTDAGYVARAGQRETRF